MGQYFIATEEKHQKDLLKKFSDIRNEAVNLLVHEISKQEGENYKSKLNEAIARIKDFHGNDSLDQNSVAFHMELVGLINEMKELSEVTP